MSHRTLRQGSSGSDVVELQSFMNDWLGLEPGIDTDGVFGSITAATASNLQSDFNKSTSMSAIGKQLVVDGIIGTNSWAVIDYAKSVKPGPGKGKEKDKGSDKDKGKKPVGPITPKKLLRNGKPFPHFWQGDSRWGSRKMGSRTIAAEGCAMCSVAMILAFYGHDIDPIKLDQYLDDNSGYSGGRNLVWQKAFDGGQTRGKRKCNVTVPHYRDSVKFDMKIRERLESNLPTLIHVAYGTSKTGQHWVVAVGCTEEDIIINDPGISNGHGSKNPRQQITRLYASTRRGGLTPVRLCLFE